MADETIPDQAAQAEADAARALFAAGQPLPDDASDAAKTAYAAAKAIAEAPPAGSAGPDTLTPPTVQPALPVTVFGDHGKPEDADKAVPEGKAGVYVDTDGEKHQVRIIATRKDGSVDIMMPATVGGYRRDAVRKRGSDEQTGDYLE